MSLVKCHELGQTNTLIWNELFMPESYVNQHCLYAGVTHSLLGCQMACQTASLGMDSFLQTCMKHTPWLSM